MSSFALSLGQKNKTSTPDAEALSLALHSLTRTVIRGNVPGLKAKFSPRCHPRCVDKRPVVQQGGQGGQAPVLHSHWEQDALSDISSLRLTHSFRKGLPGTGLKNPEWDF